MLTRPVTVTRDVPDSDPHNHLGRDVSEGETFYIYYGHTYGCVDTINGIALSERDGQTPFFEFPLDAISEDTPWTQ